MHRYRYKLYVDRVIYPKYPTAGGWDIRLTGHPNEGRSGGVNTILM